jgi:hypothetical protein
MLYREAAVRISQTALMLSRELSTSVGQMFEYQHDGKVTEEQAAEYMKKAETLLDNIYNELLLPVVADYPDLQPRCCCCETADENETDNTEPEK